MEILVMCGAGASSTFVAQRVKLAMRRAGVSHDVRAGTHSSLLNDLDSADLILLGAHMVDALPDIRGLTAGTGTMVRLLPPDISSDLDGTRTLALILDLLPPSDAAAAASTRKVLP